MTDMRGFIEGMPKAELHVHVQGMFEPELKFELARRNGMELPYQSVEEIRAAYDFDDLGAVTELDLETHAFRAIPSRVFDPLVSLTSLSMACNQTQARGQLAKWLRRAARRARAFAFERHLVSSEQSQFLSLGA